MPAPSATATPSAPKPSCHPPSSCPALPNALDTQGLSLLFVKRRKKKPQHVDKNQDVFALLDHAEKDLFLVVAAVILTTTDELVKSNAQILLKQSEL